MKHTNCPSCGAPAGSGFFCDECGGALFGGESAASPAGPPSGAAPSSTGAPFVPPGPASPGPGQPVSGQYPGAAGYPPPGPGYPPPGGYYPQPQRTVPQGITVNVQILLKVGVPILIVVVAFLVVFLFFNPFTPPKVNVPLPDGWQKASSSLMDTMKKNLESANDGAKLDAYYSNPQTLDTVVAYHFSMRGALDALPNDASLEEMEDYVSENRDSLETEILGGMSAGASGSSAKITTFAAEEMASGDVAIHLQMTTTISSSQQMTLDMLMLGKHKTAYMIMLVSTSGQTGKDTLRFLEDNITFK